MNKFSQNTTQKLGYYVYVLTYKSEKLKDVVFYVGKGKGNRVFSHFTETQKLKSGSLQGDEVSRKIQKILENKVINAYIVNAELEEKEAFLIESQLISLLRFFRSFEITNIVKGHHEYGVWNVETIDLKYAKVVYLEKLVKDHKINVLALKVVDEPFNNTINKDSRSTLEGIWRLNDSKANKAHIVIGVYKEVIFGVYRLVKNSCTKVKDKFRNQIELDMWTELQQQRGRINVFEDYTKHVKENRSVMTLEPLVIPASNNIMQIDPNSRIEDKIDRASKEYKLAKKIINRRLPENEFKTQNPVKYYFWE